jgi:hypothetical protein
MTGHALTVLVGVLVLIRRGTAPTCVRVKVAIDREPARVRTLRFGTSRC